MRLRFDQRVAIVTGAAQGIGRAIAARLQDCGARLVLIDRDRDGLTATAAMLGDASTYTLNLADRNAVRQTVAEIAARYGRIDIIAGAAGGVGGQVGRPLEDVTESDWRALFEANVDGAFWLAQAVAPVMKSAGYGRIIHIASGAGLRPSLTGIQAYTASKHALVGLTRQLSCELGQFGITVNAVAPGLVLSNPTTQRQWDSYGLQGQAAVLESIHVRRLGRAEDIANACVFLASDAASWISGQVLSVDGGRAYVSD